MEKIVKLNFNSGISNLPGITAQSTFKNMVNKTDGSGIYPYSLNIQKQDDLKFFSVENNATNEYDKSIIVSDKMINNSYSTDDYSLGISFYTVSSKFLDNTYTFKLDLSCNDSVGFNSFEQVSLDEKSIVFDEGIGFLNGLSPKVLKRLSRIPARVNYQGNDVLLFEYILVYSGSISYIASVDEGQSYIGIQEVSVGNTYNIADGTIFMDKSDEILPSAFFYITEDNKTLITIPDYNNNTSITIVLSDDTSYPSSFTNLTSIDISDSFNQTSITTIRYLSITGYDTDEEEYRVLIYQFDQNWNIINNNYIYYGQIEDSNNEKIEECKWNTLYRNRYGEPVGSFTSPTLLTFRTTNNIYCLIFTQLSTPETITIDSFLNCNMTNNPLSISIDNKCYQTWDISLPYPSYQVQNAGGGIFFSIISSLYPIFFIDSSNNIGHITLDLVNKSVHNETIDITPTETFNKISASLQPLGGGYFPIPIDGNWEINSFSISKFVVRLIAEQEDSQLFYKTFFIGMYDIQQQNPSLFDRISNITSDVILNAVNREWNGFDLRAVVEFSNYNVNYNVIARIGAAILKNDGYYSITYEINDNQNLPATLSLGELIFYGISNALMIDIIKYDDENFYILFQLIGSNIYDSVYILGQYNINTNVLSIGDSTIDIRLKSMFIASNYFVFVSADDNSIFYYKNISNLNLSELSDDSNINTGFFKTEEAEDIVEIISEKTIMYIIGTNAIEVWQNIGKEGFPYTKQSYLTGNYNLIPISKNNDIYYAKYSVKWYGNYYLFGINQKSSEISIIILQGGHVSSFLFNLSAYLQIINSYDLTSDQRFSFISCGVLKLQGEEFLIGFIFKIDDVTNKNYINHIIIINKSGEVFYISSEKSIELYYQLFSTRSNSGVLADISYDQSSRYITSVDGYYSDYLDTTSDESSSTYDYVLTSQLIRPNSESITVGKIILKYAYLTDDDSIIPQDASYMLEFSEDGRESQWTGYEQQFNNNKREIVAVINKTLTSCIIRLSSNIPIVILESFLTYEESGVK
jgi:hypothetical protein